MARIKLNQGIRTDLKSLANKLIDPKVERDALDAAYAKAAPLVRAVVEAKYKPADMKVLARYELTRKDACIRLSFRSTIEEFHFAGDEAPTVANQRNCYYRVYEASEEVAAAVTAWVAARDAHKKAVKDRYNAYAAVIDNARYLEEVVEIWPEATQVNIPNRPLVVLNPNTISLIRADVEERQAA